MRRRRLVMILAVVGMVMGVMAPAGAGGLTAEKLGSTPAWSCEKAGPHLWMHCFNFNAQGGQVRVFGHFGTDGIDPDDGSIGDYDGYEIGEPFLGTEILLLATAYHGQPCSTDGGGLYNPVPDSPFVACHHFATG